VTSSGGSALTSWAGGEGQAGYILGRLSNNAFAVLPTTGPLSAIATSLVDPAVPQGLNCYWLFPVSPRQGGLASDLLCATLGIQSGNAPRNFTVQLNQGTVATLSWVGPAGGGHTGYSLVNLMGGVTNLAADATTAQVPVSGFTCFLLQSKSGNAVVGTAEAVCATPGFSTIGQ
jgi:hypothetical protein